MNLSLLDPFILTQDLPDALEGSLRSGISCNIRFSNRGDLLASGRFDGVIVIFDVETNSVARKLRGHIRPIQSLSWNASDKYLLSSSQDCKAILWDLSSGDRIRVVRFSAPVFFAELHPEDHFVFAIALFEQQPEIVDCSDEFDIKRTNLTSAPRRLPGDESRTDQDARMTTTTIRFLPNGTHIIAGTNKGWLNIISYASGEIIASSKITSAVILSLQLNTIGTDLVINSLDRIIRTFSLPNFSSPSFSADSFYLEPEHKFQDLIDKAPWNHVCWSNSSEFVIAAASKTHRLSIWERTQGSLSKILELPEEIIYVEWHPHTPRVAAVGIEEGQIYIWNIVTPQRWSALAPDFVEVEENVEYKEKEDEFDIQPPEELHKRRLDLEDEEVDVLTMEMTKPGQYTPGAFLLPVLLDDEADENSESEDENVLVGPGQFRRKKEIREKGDWRDGDGTVTPSGDEKTIRKANGRVKRKRDL